MRKGRITFLILLGAVGYWGDGWAGVFSLECLFLLGCFVFYTGIDFFSDVARFMGRNQPQQTIVVPTPATPPPDGWPDVEGTVIRGNPDPTRPDEEEWAGAITYRLEREKGSWR